MTDEEMRADKTAAARAFGALQKRLRINLKIPFRVEFVDIRAPVRSEQLDQVLQVSRIGAGRRRTPERCESSVLPLGRFRT